MKNNGLFIGIGILIIIVVAFIVKPDFLFAVTGQETMTRSFTEMVDAGSSLTVTYSVSGASGKWGASVEDKLTCRDSSGTIILGSGLSKKFVILSDEGATTTQTYTLPDFGGLTCTFSGDYKFGDKAIKTFPTQTVKTKVICISREELGIAIDRWINGQITRTRLGEIIQEWSECPIQL